MKQFKKLSALLMALVLVIALAVPVMADDGYTLTINGKASGHTYEAYQIFTGTLSKGEKNEDVLSNIQWGSGVKSSEEDNILAALKADSTFGGTGAANEFSSVKDAESVADVLTDWSPDSPKLDRFAEIMQGFLSTTCYTSGTPDAEYHYTISGLPAGYYLIKDKDGSVVDENKDPVYDFYTKLILRVVKDGTVNLKGDVPEVEKSINDALDGTYSDYKDFDIADTAYYKWEGTLPENLGDYEKYYYKFTDNLPDELTFQQIEQVYIEGHDSNTKVHVFYDLHDDLNTNDDLDKADIKLIETKDEQTGKVTAIALDFGNLKERYGNLLATQKIVVKYSAIVNRFTQPTTSGTSGQHPVANEVYLEFSNDPNFTGEGTPPTGKTPGDHAFAFTYKLTMDKYDQSNIENKLENAQFILYYERVETATGEGGKETVTPHYAVVVTEEDIAKELVINGAKVTNDDLGVVYKFTTNRDEASVLDTDVNGAFTVKGLDEGLYYLEEIQAPSGYNTLDVRVAVHITPSFTAQADDQPPLVTVTYSVDGMSQGDNSTVGVRNTAGATLPSTGGMGTTLFYVVGGVLVAAAVVLLITKKRMTDEE